MRLYFIFYYSPSVARTKITLRKEYNNMNINENITNRVISDLIMGNPSWIRPWKTGEPVVLPQNPVSQKEYKGINILILWLESMSKGFTSPYWITVNQAKRLNGVISMDEYATELVYYEYKYSYRVNPNDLSVQTKQIPEFKTFYATNVQQYAHIDSISSTLTHINAERVLSRLGANIAYGKPVAVYMKDADAIEIPYVKSFSSKHRFYETLFYTLIKWTGHKERLNRFFGNETPIMEELIAELGTSYLCAAMGIRREGMLNKRMAAHIIDLLKRNDRAIFTAASRAHTAYLYILSPYTKKQVDNWKHTG